MKASRISFIVTALTLVSADAAPLYKVIDLSGGSSAGRFVVADLPDAPAGGWTDEYKTTKLVLRRIEPGVFLMGSPKDEFGRRPNENQHSVTITRPFYLGVFEVTQRQWELVKGGRPSKFNAEPWATRLVEQVSYDHVRGSSAGSRWPASAEVDANSFLGVLRAKTGLSFDLPNEAQWEYACRAGTTSALNSGKNLEKPEMDAGMTEVGRYWYNGGCKSFRPSQDLPENTTVVGSYRPNAWGLYDMHGNVCEWCLDWYQDDLAKAVDPVGPAAETQRVNRGGSWSFWAIFCRSAHRCKNAPGGCGANSDCVGFRLCLAEK